MKRSQTFKDALPKLVAHYKTHIAVATALDYKDLRNVSAWMKGERPFPPEHCVTLEASSGGAVTRKDLRPEDWARFWPELIAPAQTFKRARGEVVTDQRKA